MNSNTIRGEFKYKGRWTEQHASNTDERSIGTECIELFFCSQQHTVCCLLLALSVLVQSSARERESDGPWPFKTLLLVRGVLVFIYVWLEGRECPCLERAPCVNNHDVIRCNLMRGEKDFRRLTSGHSLFLDAHPICHMRDLCGPDPFPNSFYFVSHQKSQ